MTKDLLLHIGESPPLDKTIEEILKRGNESRQDILLNLVQLSRFGKVRVWFRKPVCIKTTRGRRELSRHTFSGFRGHNDPNTSLYYLTHERGRYMYPAPVGFFEHLERYELALNKDQFKSFEEFRKKFDTHFITEDEIKRLWYSKSSQHGGQYRPSDFRRFGKVGSLVMADFLRDFQGISAPPGPGYTQSQHGDYKILYAQHHTWHHLGRDISITHQTNRPYVYYSSEYQGCGNGRYGLIANKNSFLWLEDD